MANNVVTLLDIKFRWLWYSCLLGACAYIYPFRESIYYTMVVWGAAGYLLIIDKKLRVMLSQSIVWSAIFAIFASIYILGLTMFEFFSAPSPFIEMLPLIRSIFFGVSFGLTCWFTHPNRLSSLGWVRDGFDDNNELSK